jgi:hypothetical protein
MYKTGSDVHAAFSYPASRFTPERFVDLSDEQERRRLSSSALRAFFKLVAAWQLRDEQSRGLLGGISNGTYYGWKRKPDVVLDQDRITRVSYLVGIYKALHLLYGEELADQWVLLPNRNPMFAGSLPIDYMIRGGIPAMQAVRSLLDSRRGG